MTLTKGERTRQRLLESAIACFVHLGWEGASVSELATAAKVDRALFNHYFRSKEMLIQECVAWFGVRGRAQTEALILATPARLDSVERYFRATFRWVKENRVYAAFYFLAIQRAAYDRTMRAAVDAIFTRAQDGIVARWDADPLRAGRRSEDSRELARQLHMLLIGGMMADLIDPRGRVGEHEQRCVLAARAVLAAVPRRSMAAARRC